MWWARWALGCSHAPWADLVLGGERTETKGPGNGLEQETGGDTVGTRVAPRDPGWFRHQSPAESSGRPAERVDCRRFRGGHAVSPWSPESNRDRWHDQNGSAYGKH